MQMIRRFRRDIPEIPRSRRFVADALRAQGCRATDDILLVASELVTNAVRHGGGDVELSVNLDGSDVRIEVIDEGHVEVPTSVAEPSPVASGGRGLHIVKKVSRRWGSGFDAAGRTLVWAELTAAR